MSEASIQIGGFGWNINTKWYFMPLPIQYILYMSANIPTAYNSIQCIQSKSYRSVHEVSRLFDGYLFHHVWVACHQNRSVANVEPSVAMHIWTLTYGNDLYIDRYI